MRVMSLFCVGLLVACCVPVTSARAADWLQWGYDAAHSGNNTDEHSIDAGNVAQLVLLPLYPVTLAANVDSAPVYRSNVSTPGGVKNLLFVLSESGRLMAIDAATGTEVWFKLLAGTSPTESSPAVDPFGDFVYSYGLDGKVHKFVIGDGTEILTGGWPQIATLKPNVEKGAAALAIATSASATHLYAVNDGYIGDGGDYQGHLTTIDLGTGAQTVFNTLCSDVTIHMILNGQNGINDCSQRQNGIWGRPGATYDAATDRVYITTGNGLFDANTGGLHWGDSILALKPDGTGAGAGLPVDSYTPTNYDQLDGSDLDLGSASLLILQPPAGSAVQHLGLQTGKDSKLRLIDLDDMSGSGAPGGVGGEIELIDVPISESWMKTQPVTWVDSAGDGATWIYMANGAGISGLKLTLTAANMPHLQPTWQQSSSATSAIIANGVVYHIGSCAGAKCIIARDPRSGAVLWTSPNLGSVKWGSPILVDGKLFFADRSAKLWAFGLASGPATHTVTPGSGANGAISPAWPQTVVDGATKSFSLRPDPRYAIDTVTGCGGSLAGTIYTTAAITADCAVAATFVLVPTYTVTPSAGAHGSLAPDTPQTVDEGATIAFVVTPDAHYAIAAVTGCGGSLAGSVYVTGPIGADCTVNAIFAPITHVVTPLAGPNGAIAPSIPQTITDGATTSFTVTPDAHYAIDSVSGCGGNLVGNLYTTGPVTADCAVTAAFAIVTHLVTPQATPGGTITPATPQAVDDGASTSFTLAPDNVDTPFSVNGCNGTLAGLVYTTGAIGADCDVSAMFFPGDDVFRDGFDSL